MTEGPSLAQIRADLFGPTPDTLVRPASPTQPHPPRGAANPPPSDLLTGPAPLPPRLQNLLAAGAAARRGSFSPPPRAGQIVAVDAIVDARGHRVRDLARRVAVLLDAPLTDGTWTGWLAAPETGYAGAADFLLGPADGPVDPLARRVQGWNRLRLAGAAMGSVLAELAPERLAEIRCEQAIDPDLDAACYRYRWLYTCLADEISAAAVGLAPSLRRVLTRLREQLAESGEGLFELGLEQAPDAMAVIQPGWRLELERLDGGRGCLRLRVTDPGSHIEVAGEPVPERLLERRVGTGEGLDVAIRHADGWGVRLGWVDTG